MLAQKVDCLVRKLASLQSISAVRETDNELNQRTVDVSDAHSEPIFPPDAQDNQTVRK